MGTGTGRGPWVGLTITWCLRGSGRGSLRCSAESDRRTELYELIVLLVLYQWPKEVGVMDA